MWKWRLGLLIPVFIGGCSKGGSSSSDAPTPTTGSPALGVLTAPVTNHVIDPGVLSTVPIPTYTTDIVPILQANCTGCHALKIAGIAVARPRGWDYSPSPDLSSYKALMVFVSPGDAASSSLYKQVQSGLMPRGGGPPLSVADQTTIKNWINAGAEE